MCIVNPINDPATSVLEEAAMDLDSTSRSNSESLDATNPNNTNGSTTQAASKLSTEMIDASSPTTAPEPNISSAEAVKPMAENTTNTETVNATDTIKPTSPVSEVYGVYEDYQLLPDAPWPPPIFVKQNITPQERYYIEHRWYSQWSFFDNKATQNKNRYYRTQIIVGLGSVTVPVLVGINPTDGIADSILYIVTVIISLAVAMSTAIESLYTFGDNWRSYRSAAEDLHQEKSLYDVKAGRYANNPQGFIRFVERCEEIIAQQNGRWIQSQEKSAEQTKELGEEFLETYGAQEDDSNKKALSVKQVRKTTVEESFSAEPSEEEYITPETETHIDPNVPDPSAPTSFG